MIQTGGLKEGTEFFFINYIRIFFQNAADEAPAVGMEAVGFVADEYVSGLDGFRINQFAFSQQPMQKPESSTMDSGTTPGISAVSPPARMQLQDSR